MSWVRVAISSVFVCGLFGCPEQGPQPQDDVENNGSTNSGSTNNGSTNNGASTNNGVLTNNGDSEEVVARFRVDDWGLYDEPKPEDVEVTLEPADDGWVGDVDVPAGAVKFELSVGDDEFGANNATVDGLSSLVASDGTLRFTYTFNPAPRTVRVKASNSGETWRVEAASVGEAPDLPLDGVSPLNEAGRWFDDALAEISEASDPGAAVVELMHAIRDHGGPIHTEHGVLFVAPARDDETPPQIRGTWNDWEADPASELRHIAPSLWARYIRVPEGRQEYKIVYGNGESWVTDISNPHVAWDGIDPGTIGSFNSVLQPSDSAGGRLVWLPSFGSPELGNARDVFVHLPSDYDESDADHPVLYVHDGNESIVRGRFHQVAEEIGDPSIIVFVALPTQEVRMAEYTMGTAGARGDQYVAFLADTLVPFVDGNFRTRAERSARGVNGASLGGLISFWAAMQRPEVFGYAAGMSSSFFWGEGFVPSTIAGLGCQDVKYYLDSGSPNDNHDVTLEMRDILDGLGCDYHYVVDPGGQHDWSFWNGRFDGVLQTFSDLHGG